MGVNGRRVNVDIRGVCESGRVRMGVRRVRLQEEGEERKGQCVIVGIGV